tara:strand:- start:18532 stop:19041 length:510 start_codon:yes stop_codon:yes gene_type:complete
MKGTDDPSNIAMLTVQEHAEAHRVLYEEHGREQDKIAWLALSGTIGQEEVIRMKLSMAGKLGGLMKPSEEAKRKNSMSHKGIDPWNKGMKGIENYTNHVSTQLKGKPRTDEAKKKISEGTKLGMMKTNKKLGTPKGTVPWNKGKSVGPHTDDHKKKIGAGVKASKLPII